MHETYKPIKFHRAKFTRRTLKNWTNHLTPFKCHFGRLIKMAAPMAKLKQIFKVEKLNPQKEESIKSLLHWIKLNNKYTYWYSVIENIIIVKKHGSSWHSTTTHVDSAMLVWKARLQNRRATRIHYTLFIWVGKGHRSHAYLIENKRTSQGGPTGVERENRWESPVGYRRCKLRREKKLEGVITPF